jgi:hypothetical protein
VSEIVQTRDGEIRVKMRSKAKQDAANVRLAAAWSDRVAAQQFYDYADEHFDWAETAKTDRERSSCRWPPLG